MAIATVFYDFQELTVALPAATNNTPAFNNSAGLAISSSRTPIPNVQINSINYFATTVYFRKSGHFIVKCVDDPNSPQKFCYFIIPLATATANDGTSAVDFEQLTSRTAANVSFILNNSITGSKAGISVNGNDTTVLVETSVKVSITSFADWPDGTNDIWTIPSVTNNANLVPQSLEWNMNCAIEYEEESKTVLVSQNEKNDTLTLLLVTTMIAGASFLICPIIYPTMYPDVRLEIGFTHSGINYFWGLCSILAASFCIIKGALSNTNLYFFIAVTIIMVYFGGSQSLQLAGIENNDPEINERLQEIFTKQYSLERGWRLIAVWFLSVLLAALAAALTKVVPEVAAGFMPCLIFYYFVSLALSQVAVHRPYEWPAKWFFVFGGLIALVGTGALTLYMSGGTGAITSFVGENRS
jgi:hypothetical protein